MYIILYNIICILLCIYAMYIYKAYINTYMLYERNKVYIKYTIYEHII